MRLALAINGSLDFKKRTNDQIEIKLPQFSATNFHAGRIDKKCSPQINEDTLEEDECAYSDNLYGHLWFPKDASVKKVKLVSLRYT